MNSLSNTITINLCNSESDFLIEFNKDHPGVYRILKNNEDVTSKYDNNLVRDMVLHIVATLN